MRCVPKYLLVGLHLLIHLAVRLHWAQEALTVCRFVTPEAPSFVHSVREAIVENQHSALDLGLG